MLFSLIKATTKIFSGRGYGLSRIPLLKRFHSFLFDQLSPSEITLVKVQGNKMYVDPRDSGVGAMLLKSGVHELYETKLFKKAIKEEMVVVDVGAHIGYYTLMAARLVGPKGKVYAFEPDPTNYRLLIRNIQENRYRNVVAIQKAVSNKKQKTLLFLNEKDLGSHSLSKDNVPKLTNIIEIESITLDEFFEGNVGNFKVNVVKMDIQGAEGLAIEGMSKIMEKNNDLKIMMEFWPLGLKNMNTDPKKLLEKLKLNGFRLKRINREKRSLENIDINKVTELSPETGTDLWLEK